MYKDTRPTQAQLEEYAGMPGAWTRRGSGWSFKKRPTTIGGIFSDREYYTDPASKMAAARQMMDEMKLMKEARDFAAENVPGSPESEERRLRGMATSQANMPSSLKAPKTSAEAFSIAQDEAKRKEYGFGSKLDALKAGKSLFEKEEEEEELGGYLSGGLEERSKRKSGMFNLASLTSGGGMLGSSYGKMMG